MEKRIKRILVIFTTTILVLTASVGIGLVASAQEKELVYEDLFTMNKDERSKIPQSTIDELSKEWLEEQQKIVNEKLRPDGVATKSYVNVGTNKSFYSADIGNTYESTQGVGVAEASYSIASERSNVYTQAIVSGSGTAAAYTGVSVYVNGVSGGYAKIYFEGWAEAYLSGMVSGNTMWIVKAKIYDDSIDEWVGSRTIFAINTEHVGIEGGDFDNYIAEYLCNGHNYIFVLQAEAYSSIIGPNLCFVQSGSTTYHSEWDEIRIEWQ